MENKNECQGEIEEKVNCKIALVWCGAKKFWAGGTGKTTVLNVIEAFCDHFLGLESVRKAAPTNTAARLLRGDTLHALYKLPKKTLQGKRGKLSSRVLKRHRKRWKTARLHIIDEISVVPPPHLMQSDVRTRSAKQQPHITFGGLGSVLSGDFLQLPPIDKPSLAVPLDDVGLFKRELDDEDGGAGADSLSFSGTVSAASIIAGTGADTLAFGASVSVSNIVGSTDSTSFVTAVARF